ncbi:MAG: hypothetical protein WBE13_12075 [Candidatus Acidiferrum sp.]
MRRVTCVALFISSLLCSLAMRAEEIHLKDGTKINGKIIAVDGDTFQIKTAYGNIQVPRQQIVSISFPENQPPDSDSRSAAAAPPPIDESLDGASYSNKTENLQMTFPSGWGLAPEMRKQSKDIAAALESADQTLFFLMTPEKFAGTISTYEVLVETQFQMKFKDYAKLSEADVELDGRKGIKLIWHAKNPQANDSPLKGIVYIIPYDGRMVRLTFLTLEPLFDEALPIFEKTASSYRTANPTK